MRRTRRSFASLAARRPTQDDTAQNDTERVICNHTRVGVSHKENGPGDYARPVLSPLRKLAMSLTLALNFATIMIDINPCTSR